jgi:hypothetical protein
VVVSAIDQLGVPPSSIRFKGDVREMGEKSNEFMQLRPAMFLYKSQVAEEPRGVPYGLIAEEVAEVGLLGAGPIRRGRRA